VGSAPSNVGDANSEHCAVGMWKPRERTGGLHMTLGPLRVWWCAAFTGESSGLLVSEDIDEVVDGEELSCAQAPDELSASAQAAWPESEGTPIEESSSLGTDTAMGTSGPAQDADEAMCEPVLLEEEDLEEVLEEGGVLAVDFEDLQNFFDLNSDVAEPPFALLRFLAFLPDSAIGAAEWSTSVV
jgi:hypothetical protein